MISHESVEKNLGLLIVLTILIVSIGGLVQIVPLFFQTSTNGHYSVAGEYVYDRPFLWGSKRTGPDLQRVGGRYSDAWHYAHLMNPRDVVPESNMPAYPWLDRPLKDSDIQSKMRTLNLVGHGYTEQEIAEAPAALEGKTEMDAMIAYLQVLGTHAPKN
ncbi:MAG: Cytochrome oxidase, mono-heme subunit/FixO [Proteobacteria bacterium]|nr:Cytochrome oxidase, mono-heme subunit/FixO [Pseudomonadota bacterium]